ncbi:glycosyltransferase [Candidatus Woesearchaeota archaeon]|nr:glycosyltransferase [Candidatus Woesearchaeota archaeon]
MEVTIIIKSLNEQDNIAKAIQSALKAIKSMNGEVVLADSLSTDKTIQIAKKYPIRIVQLKNPEDRSCGMGAQLGYLYSKGDYVYILDGDMEIDKDFIAEGIKKLKSEKDLAGVAGIINEMTESNIIFRRRKRGIGSQVNQERYAGKLMMGGLYKRSAIQKVGYFSNPNLHAYEESDLAIRLNAAGYKLKRLPIPMIKHYGDAVNTLEVVKNRWKSRYLWGCGELLRYHIGKPTFFRAVKEMKLYILLLFWWIFLLISLILFTHFPFILKAQLSLTLLFLLLFLLKKRSMTEFLFSIFSWNITAIGLICGFFKESKDINRKIGAVRIK